MHHTFPGLQITGANYPAPPLKAAAGQAVSALQMLLVALGLAGPLVLRLAGLERPPEWLARALQPSALIGAYFVLNMVGTSLTQTGAFEVTLDGQLLYSALQSGGRVPSVQYIALRLVDAGVEPAPQAREWLEHAARAAASGRG